MAIFVIFNVDNPAGMRASIEREFPKDNFDLGANEWLISAKGTAQELSQRLGVSTGEASSAIIFSMQSYFGRASTNIWDWIKTKAEEGNG
jgi:hypothetical protein